MINYQLSLTQFKLREIGVSHLITTTPPQIFRVFPDDIGKINLRFCANLLVSVKLGYPPNINILGKPLLGEKYMEGKKKKKEEKEK